MVGGHLLLPSPPGWVGDLLPFPVQRLQPWQHGLAKLIAGSGPLVPQLLVNDVVDERILDQGLLGGGGLLIVPGIHALLGDTRILWCWHFIY